MLSPRDDRRPVMSSPAQCESRPNSQAEAGSRSICRRLSTLCFSMNCCGGDRMRGCRGDRHRFLLRGTGIWCPRQVLRLRASAYNAAALHLSYAGFFAGYRPLKSDEVGARFHVAYSAAPNEGSECLPLAAQFLSYLRDRLIGSKEFPDFNDAFT